MLIAGQGIRTRALNHALGLLRAARIPQDGTAKYEDNLDRFRRLEVQFPQEAKVLNEISQMPVESGGTCAPRFRNHVGHTRRKTACLRRCASGKVRLGEVTLHKLI